MKKSETCFVTLTEKDENAIDCQIACDCVKRANVVLGIRRETFTRTHTVTDRPASAQRLVVTTVTSNKSAGGGGAPQTSYDKRRHRNCFQTRPLQAFPKK